MSVTTAQASIDENRRASGGAAGDQTGKEVFTSVWYNGKWDRVLRCSDAAIAKKAAAAAIKLCNSNLVGYDQSARNTLYQQLKSHGWNVDSYIASGIKAETDCSAFIYAVYCCFIPALRSDSNAPTTWTMESLYSQHGFQVFSDSAHISYDSSLQTGDILLRTSGHTIMATSNGSGAAVSASTTSNSMFKVRVTANALNIRSGPGTQYGIAGSITDKGVYTIVQTQNNFGKLKSGVGWISLAYTQRI